MLSTTALLGYGVALLVALAGLVMLGVTHYYGIRGAPVSGPIFGIAGVIAVTTFTSSLLITSAPA